MVSAVPAILMLHSTDAEVSVLVLTSLRDRGSHGLALEIGTVEVLTKDVPNEQILASVKKLGGNQPRSPKLVDANS